MKKEYLTEENYERGKRKLKTIALIILLVGLFIGGSLIATGLIKQSKVNSQYSEENKENIEKQLDAEKKQLESKRLELVGKGVEYDSFAEYTDGEAYDLKVITKALNPSFDYCNFDECKNNALTSKYCSLKLQLEDLNDDFNKDFDSHDSIPFFMFGAFVIIATCMISGSIYMFTKGREVLAFQTQQVMPVAQEGIEKMAPTIGKAGASIAKEISKGIKEGIKDDKE